MFSALSASYLLLQFSCSLWPIFFLILWFCIYDFKCKSIFAFLLCLSLCFYFCILIYLSKWSRFWMDWMAVLNFLKRIYDLRVTNEVKTFLQMFWNFCRGPGFLSLVFKTGFLERLIWYKNRNILRGDT